MAKTLELAIQMNMLMQGNFVPQCTAAAQKLSELQKKTQSLQKVSGQISQFQKQSTSLDNLRQRMTAAGERVQTLQRKMAAGGVNYQQYTKELERARREYSHLEDAYKRQKSSLDDLGQSLSRAGVNTKNLADSQAKLQSQLDQSRQAQERLANAQQRYNSIREKFSWNNIKGDVMSSAAAIMAFKKPITVDMGFEQAMANVRAVNNASDEDFARMRNQSIALGSSTMFTASQAAGAQENLARSGMSVDQIIKALPATLNMAAAEGLDLTEAGAIIAKVLGGLNLGAEMAPRLADVLAYTSANSNTNIAMLGEAFKVAAPTASTQNIRLEQVASYLGALANKGFEGSEAGNALSSGIMRLAQRPKQADEALNALGVATRTRDGKMVEIPELLRQLNLKLKDKGENVQLEYMANIFGKMYGKQWMALMASVASGEHATLENGVQNNSFGAAERMNKTRNDTLQGDIISLGSAWEGLMIRIGNALDPINRFVTQTLTKGIQAINEWIDKHETLAKVLVQVAEGLGAFLVIQNVYKYIKLSYDLFLAWREVKIAAQVADMATMGTNAATVAANLGNAASTTSNFSSLLGALAGPIGIVLGASILIAANWESVTAWAKKAGEAISSIDLNKVNAAKEGTLKRSDADYGLAVMNSTYAMPAEIPPSKRYAKGGILTRPHIGLVAEAGPEAIVPLSNPKRGIPILEEAAKILGLNFPGTSEKPGGDSGNFAGNTYQKTKILSHQDQRVLNFPKFAHTHTRESIPEGMTYVGRSGNVVERISSMFSGGNAREIFSSENLSQTVGNVRSLFRPETFSENLSQTVGNVRSLFRPETFSRSTQISSAINNPESYLLERAGDTFGSRTSYSDSGHNRSYSSVVSGQPPVINITVNGTGQDDNSLAAKIASAVKDALREMVSYEERVSYA